MRVRNIAAGFMVALILAAQIAYGEDQVATSPDHRPVVTDVALHDGGVLYGQVVDAQGAAAVNAEVMLFQQGRQVAASRTNRDGQFRFTSVRAGVHQLATPHGSGHYRLWAPQTAPPLAQPGIVVAEDLVVRGQQHLFSHPTMRRAACVAGIGLVIGGVIVALDNNPPGS